MPQHKNQLSAVVKGRGQAGFSEYEVLKIFCDVCESLAELHCCPAPVIYRDLKMENVVQNDMGRFILAESNAATTRFLNPAAHGKKAVEEEIQKNTTQGYRAPEMIDLNSGHSITTKSDIWALGCLLYRLCFGSLPFGESSKAIVNCQYNIPEKCKYSSELCQLIRFMLETDPEKRPSIYQVCEVAFKISGKDNPLRIALERQKINSDYNNERKHHQTVPSTVPIVSSISVSTSVAPRSRPKGQHSGTGSGFSLGPPPQSSSPKNVASPVPDADGRQSSDRHNVSITTTFVANFSGNFPTATSAKQIAKSPAGLSMDLQLQTVIGDTQRCGNEASFR
ncbi:AP2-associated protein kinase 1-like [Armigeres subalbatus]|uniref:AP2-associated protein kinase 1-like n=1 Tax=Armigeres subalbatus TaxID=124917 RepID=UPI002ED5DBED